MRWREGVGAGVPGSPAAAVPEVCPTAYDERMVIQVDDQIEQELRRLAGHQGRALADVVEAALRSYIEAEAITDIESTDIAATQLALLSELPEIEAAEGGSQTPGGDAQG
jgi:hypothetical protein